MSLFFGITLPLLISSALQEYIGSNTEAMVKYLCSFYNTFQFESIKAELKNQDPNKELDYLSVQEQVIKKTNLITMLLGAFTIFFPFLMGIVFDNDIAFPFILGMVLAGFFISTNSTMTAGLLKSSKEWMICLDFV